MAGRPKRNKEQQQRLFVVEPPLNDRGMTMKTTTMLAIALGIGALGACNKSAQEQTADNIEANSENVADNIEANADMTADNMQANADNTADAVRNAGENKADAVRNSADADGNSAAH
jgi:hypothetical protein